jgi:hypothetical protein
MSKYLVPFINFLLIFIGGSWFFATQQGLLWFVIVSLGVMIMSGRILAPSSFWRYRWLWLNLLLVYFSQFLFLLLITSHFTRYFVLFCLALIWWFSWWLLRKYFNRKINIHNNDYLAFNIFLYSLGFWFLSSSLYAFIIFLNFPILYALLIILLATGLWAQEIFSVAEGTSRWQIIFLVFILAQILAILYFLPFSFYVSSTIATLWFFLLVDRTINKYGNFKLYLALFFIGFLLLLVSSIIY